MIPIASPRFGRRFWVLALGVCVSRYAAAGFDRGRSYQAPTDGPGWSWSLGLTPSGDGYSFTASSATTNGGSILALTRLDGDGAVDWALQTTNGPMGEMTLQADAAEPLMFAKIDGLAEEEFWSVFGLFDTRTGARVYEWGFPVIVDRYPPKTGSYFPSPSPRVQGLTGGKVGIVVDGDAGKVHVAVLDRTGQAQWAYAYQSLAFETVYTGATSRLIEDPGLGYWLIVWGTKRLSSEPNPPPVNTALTVNILRLDLAGKVAWAKSFAGLEVSSLIPDVASAIGPDGSLALALSDMVVDTSGIPRLTDLMTYLLLVDAHGKLSWARRLGRVSVPGLNFDRGDGTLYVNGVKITVLTPLASGDAFVGRLNPATGESVKSLSFKTTRLEVAGVAQGQVFVSMYTSPESDTSALVGMVKTNLENGIWRKFDRQVRTAKLSLASNGAGLMFSAWGADEERLLAIPLDFELQPRLGDGPAGGAASGCATFSEASMPGVDSQIANSNLSLTERSVIHVIHGATLPLLASNRIHLRSVTPMTGPLCGDETPATPQLSAWNDSIPGKFRLRFAAQRGVAYDLLFTPDLGKPFAVIETVTADSAVVERALSAKGTGFYAVRQRR